MNGYGAAAVRCRAIHFPIRPPIDPQIQASGT